MMGPDLQRRDQMRAMLEAQGLGGLILLRPDELVMGLGYHSYWGISLALITREGDPILYVPQLEPRDALPQAVEVRTFNWGVMGAPDPWGQLLEQLAQDLVGSEPISFLEYPCQASPAVFPAETPPLARDFIPRLKTLAGGWRNHDAAIQELYWRKTPMEVARIRRACQVGTRTAEHFLSQVQVGRSEAEVAGELERFAQAFTGTDGMKSVRAFAAVQGGLNSCHGGHFNRSSGYRLAKGDRVMLELVTCVDGYWSDLSRVTRCGEVEDPLGLEKILRQAQRAAMDLMRPGASAGEIDQAARQVLARYGIGEYFCHGLGHHSGFRYHDPGLALCPGAGWKLEAGMVLTVEPGVYDPSLGGGGRVEDMVLVHQTGIELLSGDIDSRWSVSKSSGSL